MEERRELARELVTKYPYLKERIGSGYSAWMAAIDNKMKSKRMKDPSLSFQNLSPSKRKGVATKGVSKKPCKGEINFLPTIPDSEDETSLKKHKEAMKKEVSKKNAKDLVLIETLMDKTFPHRRALITTKPFIKDLLDDFPALLILEEMNNEMIRLTGVDCEATIQTKLPGLSKSIIVLGRRYKKSVKSGDKLKKVGDILDRYDRAIKGDEANQGEEEVRAACCLLPLLLREKNEEDFVTYITNEDDIHQGAETVSKPKLLMSADTCAVAAESHLIMEGGIEGCLIFLMSLYYVVNIEYPEQCLATFTYLQKEVFGIKDSQRVMPKLATFVTKVTYL